MKAVGEQSPLKWVKARRSSALNACVELAVDHDAILIRDSKDPTTCLRYSRLEIESFLDGAKRGEFDHLLLLVAEAR